MLIWTKPAKLDVINFINNSYSKASSKKFFNDLSLYLENLNLSKNLGKTIYINDNSSIIKQLVYKQYIIYYTIHNSNIYILAVLHSKMNSYNLKKRFNNFSN